jgi:hypothetical protein
VDDLWRPRRSGRATSESPVNHFPNRAIQNDGRIVRLARGDVRRSRTFVGIREHQYNFVSSSSAAAALLPLCRLAIQRWRVGLQGIVTRRCGRHRPGRMHRKESKRQTGPTRTSPVERGHVCVFVRRHSAAQSRRPCRRTRRRGSRATRQSRRRAVSVSRPCAWGPVSTQRSTIAANTATPANAVNSHMPGR